MADRNRVWSHANLFNQHPHDLLPIGHSERLGACAQAVAKFGQRFGQP
jgi:hypothetical protein